VIDADAHTIRIRYWRFQVNKAVLLSQLLLEVSLCRTQQRAKLYGSSSQAKNKEIH